ncbi:protein C19orf12 homolog [Coturnix japonica]|uniref:Protein C19orf12 homolog n=1 Tax=Coturnix japonica TaxID=93934 RepID=A0A8C2TRJ7_COTJA|nr:protein C19orf12 homolog [Coturnix japonica]XP_015729510.1 protein C19orf12 homolog [Coturnix japonica]
MPTHVDQVMQLLCRVAQEKEMRAAIKHSREGASLAFVGAFVGGLLEGPPGIAIGGVLGGLLGAWVASGQFKPVPQIIMELPPAKQQKLYNEVIAIIRNFDWTDMVQLTALVMGNSDLKFLLTSAVEKFFIRELRAQMKYGK